MARKWFLCNVAQASVSVGVPQTTDPAIQILLTDANGLFSNTPFFAADAGKNQMLAVALSAVSLQAQVNAYVDDPTQPVNPPGAQVYSIAIAA
jgi:hypothetical protein